MAKFAGRKIKAGKAVKAEAMELPDDAFNPENVKIRISMMIDGDLLEMLKKAAQEESEAAGRKIGYQTLIQDSLRQMFQERRKKTPHDKALEEIRKQVSELHQKLVKPKAG